MKLNWPKVDDCCIEKRASLQLVVQVNGKKRATITVAF